MDSGLVRSVTADRFTGITITLSLSNLTAAGLSYHWNTGPTGTTGTPQGAPVVMLLRLRYLAGGGNSATNRSEMVSSSS